jgi:hypothetical protein
MWKIISGIIPTNILPKGQLNGSTINVTYDKVHDPDCCASSFPPSPPSAFETTRNREARGVSCVRVDIGHERGTRLQLTGDSVLPRTLI